MTTYDKQAIPGQTFLYQKGIVTTTKPWTRPSYQKIKNYITYVNKHTEILSNYDVCFTGGVLFDFDTTWDVDLCLVGGTQIDSKLEEDLNYLTNLGLNTFNLLVDIIWYENRPENLEYSRMVNNGFSKQNMAYKKIGYVKKQVGEAVEESDLRNNTNITKITDYLIQGSTNNTVYPEKVKNKVQSNPNPIVIMTFGADELLSTDEEYFLKFTNR